MADNRELGIRVRDYLKIHKERKFKRDELWSEVFASDEKAAAVDADTQRRAIGRARESAHLVGGYITHAVAANGYTYAWTELSENAVDPMLHYTMIVIGQEKVLEGIKRFIKELKSIKAVDNSAEIDLIIDLAESAQTQCAITRRNLEKATKYLIERRRKDRVNAQSDLSDTVVS